MPTKRKGKPEEPARAARGVLYCRVSSKEQEEGYSLDAQLGLLC